MSAEESQEHTNVERTKTGIAQPRRTYADLNVYRAGDVICVRLHGKTYASTDSTLPYEVRDIVARVRRGDPIPDIVRDYRFRVEYSQDVALSAERTRGGSSALVGLYWVVIALLGGVLLVQLLYIVKGCR